MENNFENLLDSVEQPHKDFARHLHDRFLNAGFKVQIENKSAGFFASYKNPKTKKSVFNFFFRKDGLHVRVYQNYISGLVDLTDDMIEEIENAPDCKRLTKTGECSPHCVMGYEFELKGKHYQKCRHKAFEFLVTEQSKHIIKKWVEAEIIDQDP